MTYQNYAAPSPEEHRLLRKHYFRLSWIMITLVLIFSGLNTLIMNISAAIMGGGFSSECINTGKELLRNDPVMSAIYSYGFPIAADIAALCIGLIVTGTDLKRKLHHTGLNGRGFLSATAVTFSVATFAAFINVFLIFIIMLAMGKLSDFSTDSVSAASIAPVGNPLWLDIIIYFYMCLLGPVLEELIFRGVLLEGLRKYGNLFGMIMSSVLFGLMHQNIIQCIPAFAIGLVWGYIAVKSDSLIPSIILHILNNTMSAVLMVLMESVDMDKLDDITAMLTASLPFITVSMIIFLFRLVCIIASVVIAVKYFSKPHGKLVDSNIFTSKRTWKYFFTSAPWLVVTIYLCFATVTSVSNIA